MKLTSYTLASAFVSAVSFIFLFLAVGMVPYWQSLNGTEIQIWWSGPFVNFATIMVPIHLLSIITTIGGYVYNRTSNKALWLFALIGLLVCQIFNFTLYGAVINPALQSGNLTNAEALNRFDDWAFYHVIRTAFVCISLLAFILIGSTKK